MKRVQLVVTNQLFSNQCERVPMWHYREQNIQIQWLFTLVLLADTFVVRKLWRQRDCQVDQSCVRAQLYQKKNEYKKRIIAVNFLVTVTLNFDTETVVLTKCRREQSKLTMAAWKLKPHQNIALFCVTGCFICLLFLSVINLPNTSGRMCWKQIAVHTFCTILFFADSCQCVKPDAQTTASESNLVHHVPDHRLAVIVPFRNRFEELQEFIPYMHRFLQAQNVNHEIFIINQVLK